MSQKNFQKQLLGYAVFGLGAAATAHYFDRQHGKRRRIELQDKTKKIVRKIKQNSLLSIGDIHNRTKGSFHEISARLTEGSQSDSLIHKRVQSVLGHYTSNPRAITLYVKNKEVFLQGDAWKSEINPLIWAVKTVRGVHKVHNQISAHEDHEDVANLSAKPKSTSHLPIFNEYWPPAYRSTIGSTGLLLSAFGLHKKGLVGMSLGILGLSLTMRSLFNRNLLRLVGFGKSPEIISVQKTLSVNTPYQQVFELWMHPENFPTFMRNVHKVERIDHSSYRWHMKGPGKIDVQWTAKVHVDEDAKTISWQNTPGSMIEHAGMVKFEDLDGSTRMSVQMAYQPPAGALGHFVSQIFHVDPKTDLDEDMVRMKSLLETGKAPHDAFIKSVS